MRCRLSSKRVLFATAASARKLSMQGRRHGAAIPCFRLPFRFPSSQFPFPAPFPFFLPLLLSLPPPPPVESHSPPPRSTVFAFSFFFFFFSFPFSLHASGLHSTDTTMAKGRRTRGAPAPPLFGRHTLWPTTHAGRRATSLQRARTM